MRRVGRAREFWVTDALQASGFHGDLDDLEEMMNGNRPWPQNARDYIKDKYSLADDAAVGEMLQSKAMNVNQKTKLRNAKKRREAAKKKSDAIPETAEVVLKTWCTACGRPDCDFAPMTVKEVKKGGKR